MNLQAVWRRFSFPEHEVLKMSYCDRYLSVVRRPSVRPSSVRPSIRPSTISKIAKIVSLRWTKWPPELKIENTFNDISS